MQHLHKFPISSKPTVGLSLALLATGGFVLLVTMLRPMSGQDQQLLYWYHAPVGFVFVLFGLDRWHWFRNLRNLRKSYSAVPIDLLVILISASRTIKWFLPLSGHTLFLTYAIGTSASRLTRVMALIVLIEAIAIKHFWLSDDVTPWVGLAVGLFAVLLRKL